MTSQTPAVKYYGQIHIGDIALECVVLADGTCGYVKRQFIQAIGFEGKNLSTRFRHFLAEIAPNALTLLDKSEYPVIKMPSLWAGFCRSADCYLLLGEMPPGRLGRQPPQLFEGEIMKTLTVQQPAASAIAWGNSRNGTNSISYRRIP